MAATILDRAIRTESLDGHDGRSGARLERVVLADGRRVIVKRSTVETDLAMRMTGDVSGRERALWGAGVLDRLPVGVGHAIEHVWVDGHEVITVMRDLGAAVVGWRQVSRTECLRLLAGAAALHAGFVGDPLPEACRLAEKIGVLSPAHLRARSRDGDALVPVVLRGWAWFADLVPADIAEAVAAVHDDPGLLITPLARRPATLIHGDFTLANVALEPGQVTLLDWGLATWAPPALELAIFLATGWSSIDASREQIIADFREASGERDDLVAMRLALFGGLVDMGWNKALDVAEHPDEAIRARERADLDWWIRQARKTLEAGLL